MSARFLKPICLLLVPLSIVLSAFAQRSEEHDTIFDCYADTLHHSVSGLQLVKFSRYPGKEVLKRYGVVKTISAQYHVLRNAGFDAATSKLVLRTANANYNWKCSEQTVHAVCNQQERDSLKVQISVTADADQVRYCRVLSNNKKYNVITAFVKKAEWAAFTKQEQVSFIDLVREAHTEIVVSNTLPSVNHIPALQQEYPALQGAGHVVGLKEEQFDTTDIDLLGKWYPSQLAAATVSSHATIMATLIAGLGNNGVNGKGVAPKARISSSDYEQLLPDDDSYFKNAGITLQNHSYGTDIENYYGAEAVAYDQQVFTLDTLLHIFSSGNIGHVSPPAGTYKGLGGYANLTGSFKQAKNVLIAGGVDTGYTVPALSSKGPSFDGRIAPQIVAYGQAGTSDAAATTTGIATLVQEAYQETYGITPSAATMKALLINTADDTGTPGPDYTSGFGIVNALAAVHAVKNKLLYTGEVATGSTVRIPLNIPANTALVKVTLAWNDPAADINTNSTLINDLDLSVTDNIGKQHLPWILSSYPSADSLQAPARKGIDHINNVEQVTIGLPSAGNVNIEVHGTALQRGNTQRFSIACQIVPQQAFEWQYPAGGEQLSADKNIAIRWKTSYTKNGTLSFSADSGITWATIATDITLTAGNSRWNIPPFFGKGLLRMQTADTTWTSNYFNIIPELTPNVGFNCPDTLMLFWQNIPDAGAYELRTLTGDHLTLVNTTTDTFLFVPKSQLPTSYITVTPVHKDGWASIQNSAYNYERQGISCFFRQVLAEIRDDNNVDISVALSSLRNLKKIFWEKLQDSHFVTLASQDINTGDQYVYTDRPGHSGIVFYRVKLELTDGRVIYSDILSVQILINQDFHLFPVPASQELTLISRTLGDYQVRFTDMNGHTILARPLTQARETYSLKGLAPGVYLCVIYEGASKIFVKRFLKVN